MRRREREMLGDAAAASEHRDTDLGFPVFFLPFFELFFRA